MDELSVLKSLRDKYNFKIRANRANADMLACQHELLSEISDDFDMQISKLEKEMEHEKKNDIL